MRRPLRSLAARLAALCALCACVALVASASAPSSAAQGRFAVGNASAGGAEAEAEAAAESVSYASTGTRWRVVDAAWRPPHATPTPPRLSRDHEVRARAAGPQRGSAFGDERAWLDKVWRRPEFPPRAARSQAAAARAIARAGPVRD